jgi:enoyl-CoA hydratase/carnithine racemase
MARLRPFATLRLERAGPVAVITLDRPRSLNAFDVAMRDDLHAALGAVDDDPTLRALLLRGRGRAFCTGGDVREFGSAPSPTVARSVRWERDVWGRLLGLRAATVAAVHGLAVGSGLEMAMLCDLCLAATGTRFALPECGLGMIPGVGGTQSLPRRVGTGRALDLTLTGRWLGAREAHRLGIVTTLVPRARLVPTARRLAARLAGLEPAVVQALRRCLRAAHDMSIERGVRLERVLGLGLQDRR